MAHQSLNLTIGQQLQLTPKLQQAIRMLQLSTQELTQELMTALETNIMLELDSQLNEIDTPLSQLSAEETCSTCDSSDQGEAGTIEISPYESSVEGNAKATEDIDLPHHYWQMQTHDSLHEYLLWQLRSSQFSEADYRIGEAIIDAINEEGFLTEGTQSLQADLAAADQHFSLEQIDAVLQKIHRFDPVGVGAKDLQQSLLLQLKAKPQHTPHLELAKRLVTEHMTLLAAHHYEQLARVYKIKKAELQQAILLIQSLNPRPGNAYLFKDESNYIVPDIVVEKKDTTWLVKLNPVLLPKLRLNQPYLSLLEECPRGANSQFIQQHLREAKWLMQCVRQRNETLLKVAACIIKHQQAFMTHGPGAMKALILKDVATELQLHQSTVSRVSNKKYIQTPQGTFELKYFFTSHINTSYGQQCSALAIQTFLKEIIDHEDSCHPYSDSKLAQLLAEKGLQVARRTISKYRELLHIPVASKRKHFTTTP